MSNYRGQMELLTGEFKLKSAAKDTNDILENF
jgi:hypothetical protein